MVQDTRSQHKAGEKCGLPPTLASWLSIASRERAVNAPAWLVSGHSLVTDLSPLYASTAVLSVDDCRRLGKGGEIAGSLKDEAPVWHPSAVNAGFSSPAHVGVRVVAGHTLVGVQVGLGCGSGARPEPRCPTTADPYAQVREDEGVEALGIDAGED